MQRHYMIVHRAPLAHLDLGMGHAQREPIGSRDLQEFSHARRKNAGAIQLAQTRTARFPAWSFASSPHVRERMLSSVGVGGRSFSEKGVRLAQDMQVGPCIPVGIQL
jgi:hypothetical protein